MFLLYAEIVINIITVPQHMHPLETFEITYYGWDYCYVAIINPSNAITKLIFMVQNPSMGQTFVKFSQHLHIFYAKYTTLVVVAMCAKC